MQTETIDRLFLELSQVTNARTADELELAMLVRRLIHRLRTHNPEDEVAHKAHGFLERKGLLGSPLKEANESDSLDAPITLQWLHNNLPEFWERKTRGIESAGWSIHQSHTQGPFVWAVNPTHDANMNVSSNKSWFAILVLKTKGDVIDLLKILNADGVTP